MIYITGDTHRSFYRIQDFCIKNNTSPSDTMIILGDAGINFFENYYDERLKDWLSTFPITFFLIHGNHEVRPQHLKDVREISYRGSSALREEKYPNLIYAIDGNVYDFDGKSCLVVGGAYSVDKPYRMKYWWDDEQPSDETKLKTLDAVIDHGKRFDFIFTHTCPHKYIPAECYLSGIDQRGVDVTTELFLNVIEDSCLYERWFCGHWHTDKTVDRIRFLYNDIVELK